MKNLLTVAGVALDAALIVLSLALMLAGYMWWGAVALAAAGVLVAAAARFWRNTPDAPAEREWHVWDEELEEGLSDVERQMLRAGYVPVDPVDAHAATAIAHGEPGWPEMPLIQPKPRPGRHRQDNR